MNYRHLQICGLALHCGEGVHEQTRPYFGVCESQKNPSDSLASGVVSTMPSFLCGCRDQSSGLYLCVASILLLSHNSSPDPLLLLDLNSSPPNKFVLILFKFINQGLTAKDSGCSETFANTNSNYSEIPENVHIIS